VAQLLGLDAAEALTKCSATGTAYVVLAKDAPYSVVEQIRINGWKGIGVNKDSIRFYPEAGMGGQLLGFVSASDKNERVGKYGVEGFQNTTLAGEAGSLITEKDAAGRRLTVGTIDLKEAKNGSDVILTIDRQIQTEACKRIEEAVAHFKARNGTIIIMDPDTGAVLAMCSSPDFKPGQVGEVRDLSVLNNPATFYQFEPGSSFKPITMAAGLETGKVTSRTTYVDTGAETIDGFTIRNADHKAHGLQTMEEVLNLSLNTGSIFVERLLGASVFRDFVAGFGFGVRTGIELPTEAKGDITPLLQKGKIFGATASFGQGISVTPIQLTAAYAALGNGGRLMKPYVIDETRSPDGTIHKTKPQLVNQVISSRTSRLISGMLVDVVERGHGKRAAVPGYYVGGKTGTAQIPNPRGGGYLPDATIGTFVGFAPIDHPRFSMLIKIERPTTVEFAESSAAPVFGQMAAFLLSYFHVPPERPIKAKPLPPLPMAIVPVAATGTKP
jgi:cell division protein FtsI/penicillin-binding protein 2